LSAKRAVRLVENRTATPHTLAPTTFNDAQGVGDRFKSGQPVIVNLQGADRDLRRRLIDFASGLCYALDGKMDRITEQVYLLSPADVDIADADRRGFE
jgi:cell division inhibitor SepF